jgi:hypothetical protein
MNFQLFIIAVTFFFDNNFKICYDLSFNSSYR